MLNSINGGMDCFSDKERILSSKELNLGINCNAGVCFQVWQLTLDIIKVLKQFTAVNTKQPLLLVQSDSEDTSIELFFNVLTLNDSYIPSHVRLGEPLSYIKFQPYFRVAFTVSHPRIGHNADSIKHKSVCITSVQYLTLLPFSSNQTIKFP